MIPATLHTVGESRAEAKPCGDLRTARARSSAGPLSPISIEVGRGVDVEFRTNEQPPFLNKLVINHALPMAVDGEPALQWIASRFNGEPTTPNCGQF